MTNFAATFRDRVDGNVVSHKEEKYGKAIMLRISDILSF